MYRIDNSIFVGLYWNHKTMTEGPQFEINIENKKFTSDFLQQFSDIWKTAEISQEIYGSKNTIT